MAIEPGDDDRITTGRDEIEKDRHETARLIWYGRNQYMYVRMYVCTYVCMYVCMYVCFNKHICMDSPAVLGRSFRAEYYLMFVFTVSTSSAIDGDAIFDVFA